MNANTTFTTENAERYLGTLCKHFGHKIPAKFANGTGHIEFPFGTCELSADPIGLSLHATADNRPDLDRVVQVVTSHLERFAFRENPQIQWAFQ